MKKLFILAISLIAMTSVSAQESTDKKPAVAVDQMTYNSSVGSDWAKNLRNQIVTGILNTGRVEIVDVESIANLPTAEAERLAGLKDANAEYVVKGHVNSMNKTRETKDGVTHYRCRINYTLTLINLATGATQESKSFDENGYSTENETTSVTKAINAANTRMKRFVEECFKLRGLVKALDKVNPKKGVETIYITLGSNVGLQEGQPFDVFVETDIAGEIISKQIKGSVRAKEIVSGGLCLATVHGKEAALQIMNSFDSGKKVIVVSRPRFLEF